MPNELESGFLNTLNAVNIVDDTSKKVLDTSARTSQEKQDANNALLTTIGTLGEQTQAEIEKLNAASKRREAMAQNPAIVNTVLGLFDPNFNMNVQNERVKRAQFNLENIKNETRVATQTRDLTVANANTELNDINTFYNIAQK